MSPPQVSENKKQAFRAVAKDDASGLAGVFGTCPMPEWSKWQNQAGQSLLVLCKERGAFKAYAVIAQALGLSMNAGDAAEPSTKAFRAVANDDMIALAEALSGLKMDMWMRWRNKAGKDLLTMSRERNSKGAHATLRRALSSPIQVDKSATQSAPTPPAPAATIQPTATAPASAPPAPTPTPTPSVSQTVKEEAAETKTNEVETVKVEPPKEEPAPTAKGWQPPKAADPDAKAAEAAKKQAQEERAKKSQDELNARLARQAAKAEDAEKAAEEESEKAAKELAEKKAKDSEDKAGKEAADQAAQEDAACAKEAAEKEAKEKAEAAEKAAKEEAEKAAAEAAAQEALDKAAVDRAAEKAAVEEKVTAEAAEAAKVLKAEAEAAAQPPATFQGGLQKKGKGGFFRKAWDQRHVRIQDGVLEWFKDKTEVGKVDSGGHINLRTCKCEAVPDPSDKDSLIVRPKSGNWTGQHFKGADEGREFTFNVAGCETDRPTWLKAINSHCEWGINYPQ